MANYAAFWGIALVAWTASTAVEAWPAVQTPNSQAAPSASWPWTGGERNEPFETPNSFSYPIPGPRMTDGGEGYSPRWTPHLYSPQSTQANLLFQGLGSDPWSAFQTTNPFGPGSPYDFSSQEPFATSFGGTSGTEDFPYTRPYLNLFSQTQYPQYPASRSMTPDSMYAQSSQPFPMSPYGLGSPPSALGAPMMGMSGGQHQMPLLSPPQNQHHFGHMMGQSRPYDWTRIIGRSNPSEMAPSSSPFDFVGPPNNVEYSPSRLPSGRVPAITVQYNVTYTFSPWGWKTVDVSVSNATFQSAASERAVEITGSPSDGIVPQFEPPKTSDTAMRSGLGWWPKKTGPEVDGKATIGTGQAGGGVAPVFPHPARPQ